MKITKRTKKNIGNMTFKQLMEAFSSDDETSNLEGFDEFEDADADADADADIDDAEDADSEGDEVTVTLSLAEVDVLRGILAKIDGDAEESDDADFSDIDDADEADDEADEADDEADEADDADEEDEEAEETEETEEFDEDEEVTVTDGAPTRKQASTSYSNKTTVDSVYTRGAKSGLGSAATVSGQGPTKKVGTPATNANASTVASKIAPGKHVFEI